MTDATDGVTRVEHHHHETAVVRDDRLSPDESVRFAALDLSIRATDRVFDLKGDVGPEAITERILNQAKEFELFIRGDVAEGAS